MQNIVQRKRRESERARKGWRRARGVVGLLLCAERMTAVMIMEEVKIT